jgi:hypothetical protein
MSCELRFNAYLRRTKVYSRSIRARVVAFSQSAFHITLARSQWYRTWHRCICRHTRRKVRARLRKDIANEAKLCQSTSKRKHLALIKNSTLLERLSLCHNIIASPPSYRKSYNTSTPSYPSPCSRCTRHLMWILSSHARGLAMKGPIVNVNRRKTNELPAS